MSAISARPVEIRAGVDVLNADLRMPPHASGLVIFAHGSGSSRFSSRNRRVAEFLHGQGFAVGRRVGEHFGHLATLSATISRYWKLPSR